MAHPIKDKLDKASTKEERLAIKAQAFADLNKGAKKKKRKWVIDR